MHTSNRWPILVLAAPFFLSACGSGADDKAPTVQTSSARQSMQQAAVTIFEGFREDYAIVKAGPGFTVTHKTTSAAVNVAANARLRFYDTSLALDIDGTSGKAYRLYRAAFARTPDLPGLSYWITAMDAGTTPEAVAIEFAKSTEFKTVYGAAPANADIVARYYQNVLGRQGEPAGVAYWVGLLDSKAATIAQVLYGFSESAENKDAVQATIGLGIAYNEPGVAYKFGPLIDPLTYAGGTMATTMAEALASYNASGARGYAFVGSSMSLSPAWSMDLYQLGGSGTAFTYRMTNAGGASAAARLANMEAEGAKGYLYKSTAIYGNDLANSYDLFVKTSARNTTYSYRMKAEEFNLESVKANGAQGYAYRGQIVIDNTTQNLYVKDNSANVTYDYKTSPNWGLSNGLLATMNEFGTQAYAYQGSTFTGTEFVALFARSSGSSAPYSYTVTPRVAGSVSAYVEAMNQRSFKGEAYYGDLMDGATTMSVYYKGPVIVHPLLGPVFP